MLSTNAPSLAARASQRLKAVASYVAASQSAPTTGVGRLHASETALFVCDVQEKFRPIIAGMPAVIDTARRMIRGAEALQLPVVVTEQYPKALGHTVEELQAVLPEGGLVQDKFDFTMCVQPVKQFLEQHQSVRKTVVDLLESGYEVHLIVDGVSSKRASDRATAIQRIAQIGGFLVTSEMALFQLCGSSKHPAFKTISALAKEDRPEFIPLTSSL